MQSATNGAFFYLKNSRQINVVKYEWRIAYPVFFDLLGGMMVKLRR